MKLGAPTKMDRTSVSLLTKETGSQTWWMNHGRAIRAYLAEEAVKLFGEGREVIGGYDRQHCMIAENGYLASEIKSSNDKQSRSRNRELTEKGRMTKRIEEIYMGKWISFYSMMMLSKGKRPVLVESDIMIQEEGILYDQSVLRMRAIRITEFKELG
ncbi:hypothetical protein CFP56_040093 [Quercus suber]|uniref:YqaJ viral recombinase domain-containing protein n=1 Tax=Quercus suber TaxID=58331 RepID=A0AAW0LKC9_QUESU